MKKWLFIGAGCILTCALTLGIIIYFSLQPHYDTEKEAFKIAKDESSLETTSGFHWFRYEKEYYVVAGNDSSGEAKYVWIDPDKKQVVLEHKASEGISEEEILEIYQDEWNIEKLMGITLGYANKRPIWEIKFVDAEDKYTIMQVAFLNGDWIRYYQYK